MKRAIQIQSAVTLCIVLLVLVHVGVRGQTPYTYTVPMLQDTVVVITNPGTHDAKVAHQWYDSMGILIEWQSGANGILPQNTVALWYCLPVGDAPWFSLVLTSDAPLVLRTYMDREIAQGYGCP